MKKLSKLFILVVTVVTMISATVLVNADTTTDLSSMKVYAVDASGNKTVVPMEFRSTTYEYNLTVMSSTVSIAIEASTADSSSTWKIEKDGINTKMDTGRNYTEVSVTSSAGVVQIYKLNTTKLTTEEEATYEAPDNATNDDANNDDNNNEEDEALVIVGKTQMKIMSSFDEKLIPEGFEKAKAEYNGIEHNCIKGEVKSLTAFYLKGDDTEGFYIYDADKNEFYEMNNIMIKSRMYTIVEPENKESFLKNYKKNEITIIDQDVEAWVLDADEGMYLVYAMNWNGDTNLYCYDDNEKCFQKYLLSSNETAQVEAAKKAYENIQNKYNDFVDKYNIMLKVTCSLVIVLVILIFVIINLAISNKEKKIKKNQYQDNEEDEITLARGNDKNGFDDEQLINTDEAITNNTGSEEAFYGGEDEHEDSVLIDLFEDEYDDEEMNATTSADEQLENETFVEYKNVAEVAEDEVGFINEVDSDIEAALRSEVEAVISEIEENEQNNESTEALDADTQPENAAEAQTEVEKKIAEAQTEVEEKIAEAQTEVEVSTEDKTESEESAEDDEDIEFISLDD